MSVYKADVQNDSDDAMLIRDSKQQSSNVVDDRLNGSDGSCCCCCCCCCDEEDDDHHVGSWMKEKSSTPNTCPTEAQCRCHMSYSCDYRTVDVRWKCPTRNSNSGHPRYLPNCCHPRHSSCHPNCHHHHHHESSSLPSCRISPSSYSSTSSSPSSSSSSASSSFLSSFVDKVVDNSCECALNPYPKCSGSSKNNYNNNNNNTDLDAVSYLCDVINWRRRRTRSPHHPSATCLQTQDLNMTTLWIWDFTSKVHRFMTRFSGRRRRPRRRRALNSLAGYQWARMTSFLYVIFVVMAGCLHFHVADACSSRSTPKPRPPSPTLRPNITIQTYTCPPEYAAHYCLNGATCFTVKIGESILYNCECAEGYMGQRCEFKDLDGSYLPSKQRAMLEQAGITSGVAIMVVCVIIVFFYLYVRSRRKSDTRRSNGQDEVDNFVHQARRPFSGLHSPTTVHHHHHHHHHLVRPTMLPPSTFPTSNSSSDKALAGMTCESLPNSPTKTHNSPATGNPAAEIQTTTTMTTTTTTNNSNNINNSPIVDDTKSAVLLKTTIVPNNNQSRLCV